MYVISQLMRPEMSDISCIEPTTKFKAVVFGFDLCNIDNGTQLVSLRLEAVILQNSSQIDDPKPISHN